MKERHFYPEIFLISLAIILLEISYTRVFSFKLHYYFTYLIIGVSLLGIGAGGVFVTIVPRLRRVRPQRLILVCCLIGGAAILVGYFVIALTQLNAFHLTDRPGELPKLVAICLFLFAPFLMAGLSITTIFGACPAQINRLYATDLTGAGLGCAVCVPLIYFVTPPGCVLLSGLLLVAAAIRQAALEDRGALPLIILLGVPLAAGTAFPGVLPDPVPDEVKTMSPQAQGTSAVVFSRWSPVFRVDVMKSGSPDSYIINHDGLIGSGLHRFNGDLAMLNRFDTDVRSFPFRLLKPAPKVLIIGSAGGHEILASLHFGASHVTAVELNPVTVSLLTTYFADYSGHLAENERVTLVNGDGRSFVKRDNTMYDLIWFVAPDSYSAMNAATSGAFVLSESYLYTTGMIRESLAHLTDGGLICMEFGELNFDVKPNRTARYVGTAREAFREIGINDFDGRVLVATTQGWLSLSTILLKKAPFSSADVERFAANAQALKGSMVRYAPGQGRGDGPIYKIVTLPEGELQAWYAKNAYDVRPITDDSPFFWHFARFRDVARGGHALSAWSREDGTGEQVLLVLLVFVIVFAAAFLFLPFLAIRETWRRIPYKLPAAVYFAAIGTGFMFFEVSLIQKFTLFLGYPTYSLTVTLFALLICTGIGSLLSEAYRGSRDGALLSLLGVIILLMLAYQFALSPLVDRLIGLSLAVRIALAVLFMAPLGICLGAFMPIGLATISGVTEHRKEFIAWGWAVNGFFSVISSILTTILSMTVGFRVVMLLAAIVYAIGIAFLVRVPAPTSR